MDEEDTTAGYVGRNLKVFHRLTGSAIPLLNRISSTWKMTNSVKRLRTWLVTLNPFAMNSFFYSGPIMGLVSKMGYGGMEQVKLILSIELEV